MPPAASWTKGFYPDAIANPDIDGPYPADPVCSGPRFRSEATGV